MRTDLHSIRSIGLIPPFRGKEPMAELLTTTGISFHLEQIIRNGKERVVIISPYLKINRLIRDLLEDKDRLKIDVRVIYGKTELQPEESQWLESMRSIRTSFSQNLHAKCYLNEDTALLTSKNLYEFSQNNNDEMGILVSRIDDPDLYESIKEGAQSLLRKSEEVRVSVARVQASETEQASSAARPTRRQARPSQERSLKGFCIRCKAELPADPGKPYCERCFRS